MRANYAAVMATCPSPASQTLSAHVQAARHPAIQLEIFSSRARRLILKAHGTVRSSAETLAEAFNEHMMLIISASRAHIEFMVLKSFTAFLANLPKTASEALRLVLNRLCSVFALSSIINSRSTDAISFLETTGTKSGYPYSEQLGIARAHDVLDQLLLEVIGLTDAWGFTDASLCSALGMYDGNVYKNIMRWIEQMPINKAEVHEGWNWGVEPILKGKDAGRAKL
jgi:acyl-CoA oxidase